MICVVTGLHLRVLARLVSRRADVNAHRAAEGRYAAIPQDGGTVVAVATPYDDDLKKLATEFDRTYLEYGSSSFRHEKKAVRSRGGDLAMSAPAGVAADRAAAKAAAAPKMSEDIVDFAKASGGASTALASLAADALPDELRGKASRAPPIVRGDSREHAAAGARTARCDAKNSKSR
jgi:hypothetical protein